MIDYSSEAGDSYHKARHKEIFGNKALIDAWGAYSASEYLRGLKPDDRVLEIGAGTGINICQIAVSHDVYAVEPSEYARNNCAAMGVKTFASVGSLPPEIGFDRILLRHVLEHVESPAEFLAGIRPHLKPTGEFVIVLPIENPTAPVDSTDIDHHLYCWNPQTISNLLKYVGYEPTEIYISHHNGRRIFIPIYKLLGLPAYRAALRILGLLTSAREVIIRCKVPLPALRV